MRIYNTLSRQKEEIVPLEPGKVRNCRGSTVYNFIHIGNAPPLGGIHGAARLIPDCVTMSFLCRTSPHR